MEKVKNFLQMRNANFIREKSGLFLAEIYQLYIKVAEFNPIAGNGYIPLPKYLQAKKAIVNIQNKDNRCFAYAVTAALYKEQLHSNNSQRAKQYERFFKRLGLDKLSYPISPLDMEKIERMLGLRINIFSMNDDEGKELWTMYFSESPSQKEIDLFYWDVDGKAHYAPIIDFSRFATRGKTKHHGESYWCKRCLGHFRLQTALKSHQRVCVTENFISNVHQLPEPGTFLQFKNTKYQTEAPIVIYADLESVLTLSNVRNGATVFEQEHRPCSAHARVSSNISVFDGLECEYHGSTCVRELLKQFVEWERIFIAHLKVNRPMKRLDYDKEVEYQTATQCYICHRPFNPDSDDLRKVADHDHITGLFEGAAHNSCNKQRRVVYDIPIFFHNFRGYDSHLIVEAMSQLEPEFKKRELDPIGQTMDKYMQVKWGDNLVFRDSLQHMTSPLESLVDSLRKSDPTRFYILEAMVKKHYHGQDHKLLLRKGVFPYDYLNSFDRFGETQLPPREAFYNKLREVHCSEDDYNYAQEVWTKFGCKIFKDYLVLYLRTDVALLADVFQNHRKNCRMHYRLDPAYYVSLPSNSWDAFLKMGNLKLELISDPAMYKMLLPNNRGGIVNASGRYAKANNHYMGALYDATKPDSFIAYYDANNLYGFAMSQYLPYRDFEWVSDEEINEMTEALIKGDKQEREGWFDFESRCRDEMISNVWQHMGYIIHCDLEYPPDLHDRDDDYPLAPEHIEITGDILSDKQHELSQRIYGDRSPYSKKLACTLYNKKGYVVLSDNLKYYLERGMRVTKIHKAMKFETRKFAQGYIDFNTKMRASAKGDESLRSMFKLFNNAIYGKSVENVGKRKKVNIYTDMDKAKKQAEKPQCIGWRVYNDGLIGMESRKINQLINKPFQMGFAVLELSKLHMFKTADRLKDHFGRDKIKILYTDTDSLIIQFYVHDLYKELQDPTIRDIFDFSEVPAGHASGLGCPNDPRKGAVGYLKDECKGDLILEYVGLKAKMYSYDVCECLPPGSTAQPKIWSKQVGKGISKTVIKKTPHQNYLDMYRNQTIGQKVINRRIGCKLHKVYFPQ
jgi:hypothetical protein